MYYIKQTNNTYNTSSGSPAGMLQRAADEHGYIHIYIYIYICMHIYAYTCMYVCMYVCM